MLVHGFREDFTRQGEWPRDHGSPHFSIVIRCGADGSAYDERQCVKPKKWQMVGYKLIIY